jgi:hypothetical protein
MTKPSHATVPQWFGGNVPSGEREGFNDSGGASRFFFVVDDEGPGLCNRGLCAAERGHEGTCAEASGWTDEEKGTTP